MLMLEREYFEKANDHQKMGFATLGDISIYVFATLRNHGIHNKPRQLLLLNQNIGMVRWIFSKKLSIDRNYVWLHVAWQLLCFSMSTRRASLVIHFTHMSETGN